MHEDTQIADLSFAKDCEISTATSIDFTNTGVLLLSDILQVILSYPEEGLHD